MLFKLKNVQFFLVNKNKMFLNETGTFEENRDKTNIKLGHVIEMDMQSDFA